MLSSAPPISSPWDVNSPNYFANQLFEIAPWLKTQDAAVRHRWKILSRAVNRLKALYQGRNGSNISGIPSQSTKQNVDNGGNFKIAWNWGNNSHSSKSSKAVVRNLYDKRKDTMLASVPPIFKPIRCKLTQQIHIINRLKLHLRLKTQDAAVRCKRKIWRRAVDSLKALYKGRKRSNISIIQS